MKVLLDEDLPHELRFALPYHVFTVRYMGWNGLKNGILVRAAEDAGFDVLVTGDQNLTYQQNLKSRRLAFVVLPFQELPKLQRCAAAISAAIEGAVPGSVQVVSCI